jgi:hypothetical protein
MYLRKRREKEEEGEMNLLKSFFNLQATRSKISTRPLGQSTIRSLTARSFLFWDAASPRKPGNIKCPAKEDTLHSAQCQSMISGIQFISLHAAIAFSQENERSKLFQTPIFDLNVELREIVLLSFFALTKQR